MTHYPIRILVVDDNSDAADLLAMMLDIHGHSTATAHGGVEGIRLARSFKPDVVFLDIGMPDLSGYEVATALRAEPGLEHTKIIALTAWNDEQSRARVADVGFDCHLVKPAPFERVAECLAAIWDSARPLAFDC